MSLYNLEANLGTSCLTLKTAPAKLARAVTRVKRDGAMALREVSTSPHLYPAALRVSVALAVSFGLVHVAKFLLT